MNKAILMIDITELEQYFPELNKSIKESPYTFTIFLNQNIEEKLLNKTL